MKNNFFNNDKMSAYDAQYEAQKIAFAPIVFQVARVMRDKGLLELLYDNRKKGLTFEQIEVLSEMSSYGLKTLLETGLSANIVNYQEDKYFISKIGFYLLKDNMTRINMDYNHYVNYLALFNLEESIDQKKPVGLNQFGNWSTIYPGLTSLPEKVSDSWFNFDHYYSDSAFPDALKEIENKAFKHILDIGGNTGKFSLYVTEHSDSIKLTIADLPEQIMVAQKNISAHNMQSRIQTHIIDVLDPSQELPKDTDLIWMSQFLDCFDEQSIIAILNKAMQSMSKNTELWIMEPLWDRQKYETSAYCIINTSPYFTVMANGYSKMYHSKDLIRCINKAGLDVIEIIDNLGVCQSIIRCKY
jgi:hypothetical protein